MSFLRFFCWFVTAWSIPGLGVAWAAGYGFDVLERPGVHAQNLAQAGLTGAEGTWMRVRGVAPPWGSAPGREEAIAADRAGLRALRAKGIKTVAHLRWDSKEWLGGVRAGGGWRLPLDLREAFARGRALGATYGDVVDAWEIENEPDIFFVAENPEVYAAFQKAIYLGLKAGAGEPAGKPAAGGGAEAGGERSNWRALKRGLGALRSPIAHRPSPKATRPSPSFPLVLPAPLALPPGPYFERLWENGLASYLDGFNYHYYGYPDDFTGVYRQFEDAVTQTGTGEVGSSSGAGADSDDRRGDPQLRFATKSLPVFLTEYGYGLLDGPARNTIEGRVRQWAWYAGVAKQIRALRIEGPMAFVLNPYLEVGMNEFGLLMEPAARVTAGGAKRKNPEGPVPDAPRSEERAELAFRPEDFGETQLRPWMRRVGQPVGAGHASPALAWLWDQAARHPYRPRSWTVRAAAPSPVVIDFVAGSNLVQMKSYRGYLLTGTASASGGTTAAVRTGQGRVVLYNFSGKAVTGRLWLSATVRADGPETFTLAAGERREVLVEVTVPWDEFRERRLGVEFRPEAGPGKTAAETSRAVYLASLYANATGMAKRPVETFEFPAVEPAVSTGASGPAAEGAPRVASGRWRVTAGVTVVETEDAWRFTVTRTPPGPLHPAAAALVLPETFVFEPGMMWRFDYRLGPADASGRLVTATRTGFAGNSLDLSLRAANGNVYRVPGRLGAAADWRSYAQNAENFSLAFFGRAALPWRFTENRMVELELVLRPAEVPAVFELRKMEIVRWQAAAAR